MTEGIIQRVFRKAYEKYDNPYVDVMLDQVRQELIQEIKQKSITMRLTSDKVRMICMPLGELIGDNYG